VLDEVQRAPEAIPGAQSTVDRRRAPGRFILTGSTNVILVARARRSWRGAWRSCGFIRSLSVRSPAAGLAFSTRYLPRASDRAYGRLGAELAERVAAGGYPARSPALRRDAAWPGTVNMWSTGAAGVRDLAAHRLAGYTPRLLQLAAGQTARLINVAEMAGPFQLSRPTIATTSPSWSA